MRSLRTGLALPLMGALLISWSGAGCDGAGEVVTPEEPEPEAWTPPVFEGDGLPASEDLEHQTADGAAPAPTPGGGGEDEPEISLSIYDGVFSWSYNQLEGYTANLILLDRTQSCHAVFGALDSFTSDGLYFTVKTGQRDEAIFPEWTDLYRLCQGRAPCIEGYAVVGGERIGLGDRAFLDIVSYDVHYITTSWRSPVSSGEDLTFYNCGAKGIWNY